MSAGTGSRNKDEERNNVEIKSEEGRDHKMGAGAKLIVATLTKI